MESHTAVYAEDESVVRRFARVLGGTVREAFVQRASIREPARIVPGPEIEGVRLRFLDLSSLSVTGTFKDWVACVTAAVCLERQIPAFVTQSSGNTANALARYAAHCGIRAVILYPQKSRYKINPETADAPGITMIEVAHPEPQLKVWADEAAERYRVPWLPRLDLQCEGNKLRAYFLDAWLRDTGERCDWQAQALSSAFGPIGTYQGFHELTERGAKTRWPRFLGVQQEAVHPFATDIAGYPEPEPECPTIEPTLFRTQPSPDLYQAVREICRDHGGTVTVIENQRVDALLPQAVALLESVGFSLAKVRSEEGYKPVELASVICMAGVLEAISDGTIQPGETVLVTLTGGLARRRAPAEYIPRLSVNENEGANRLWELIDTAAQL